MQLWKTERIETNVKVSIYRASGGGTNLRMSTEEYPLGFFYRENQTENPDDGYVFEKSEWRDAVLKAIKEVSGTEFPFFMR